MFNCIDAIKALKQPLPLCNLNIWTGAIKKLLRTWASSPHAALHAGNHAAMVNAVTWAPRTETVFHEGGSQTSILSLGPNSSAEARDVGPSQIPLSTNSANSFKSFSGHSITLMSQFNQQHPETRHHAPLVLNLLPLSFSPSLTDFRPLSFSLAFSSSPSAPLFSLPELSG